MLALPASSVSGSIRYPPGRFSTELINITFLWCSQMSSNLARISRTSLSSSWPDPQFRKNCSFFLLLFPHLPFTSQSPTTTSHPTTTEESRLSGLLVVLISTRVLIALGAICLCVQRTSPSSSPQPSEDSQAFRRPSLSWLIPWTLSTAFSPRYIFLRWSCVPPELH